METILIVGGVIILLLALYIIMYNRLKKLYVKVEEGSSGIDVALEKRYDLLSEEIEAVKKYLAHEYETFVKVSQIRSNTEEQKRNFDQQKELTEDAMKSIDARLNEQTKQMEQIKRNMETSRRGFTRSSNERYEAQQAANQQAMEAGLEQNEMTFNHKLGMMSNIHRDLSGVGASVNALMEQYPTLYSWISMEHFQKSIFDAEEHLQAARRLYNANASLYNQAIATFPQLIVAAIHRMKKVDFYQVEEQKKSFAVKFD
ncbi:MAG: LemA family protein [Firmicutes bacterium]|nr:LemA family protein [Bacillota bacterium]